MAKNEICADMMDYVCNVYKLAYPKDGWCSGVASRLCIDMS